VTRYDNGFQFCLPLMVQADTPCRLRPWGAKILVGYDTQDAFAVTIICPSFAPPTRLTFARELLAEGQHRPAGHPGAAIAVRPDGDKVVVLAHSPSGTTTTLRLPTRFVDYFLDLTYQQVPAGSEGQSINWDRLLGESA
jgi:hypothetical protein